MDKIVIEFAFDWQMFWSVLAALGVYGAVKLMITWYWYDTMVRWLGHIGDNLGRRA